MKKLLTLAALLGATAIASAQGTVNFANSATTLISAGGVSTPVGGAFIYALFLAPSTTVGAIGQGSNPLFTDPAFQAVGGSTTNHPTATGRLAGINNLNVGGTAGSSVDFLVRGWSANAGATWAEALASWNNGSPLASVGSGMFIGQSLIGNDLKLGDGSAIPSTTLFGAGATQVGGFNMAFYAVPEPTSMALAGLGAASLLIFRRRK